MEQLQGCRLSVNINKIATLRNSRGGNVPNLIQVAKDCEQFGAEGITVHPRPDERHIRYDDVHALKEIVSTEFNIEGNPKEPKFIQLIETIKPHQVTLVPDAQDQLTSDHGWDTIKEAAYLKEIVAHFKSLGCRVSLFADPIEAMVEGAKNSGADRVELYTEQYATDYATDKQKAIAPYVSAAQKANEIGLGVNAGHDLSLLNLQFLYQQIPYLAEVSIGHALIADALYFGLQNTIQLYRRQLL